MIFIKFRTVFVLVVFFNCAYGYHLTESGRNFTRYKRQAPCKRFEFKCKSGECISDYSKCDGVKDCSDGSDETAQCRKTICPEFSFRCGYGACVDGGAECNGVEECFDGSDENTARCPKNIVVNTCGKDKFTCQNKQCISRYAQCDGKKDCSDGTDETFQTCSRLRCPDFAHTCAYGACIDREFRCDGKPDCADGSDESPILCGKPNPVTERPTTTTTTSPEVDGCILPNHPENGKYSISGGSSIPPGTPVADGTFITYSCNPGYALLPELTTINVCYNHMWSHTSPLCIKTCPARISDSIDIECTYDNKPVNCSKPMYEGTLVKMKCKYHYESADQIYRNPYITCKDGTWDFDLLRCYPSCGKLVPKGGQLYVVGGKNAQIGDFPWHVGLYEKILKADGSVDYIKHICGGSIINMKVIISAAHCVTDVERGQRKPANLYLVAAGKYYRDYDDPRDEKTIQKNEVSSIIVPVEYRGIQSSFTHDIALLVLKEPFTISNLIQPVCVDWSNSFEEEQLQHNNQGMVAGWGLTVPGALVGAESLKELSVPFIERETCFNTIPADFATFYTTDKICAGWTNGSSVCEGDSGGGLVFLKKDLNRFFIRGLVSSGPIKENSCNSEQVGLYTKISAHLEWIRRKEADNKPT